MASSPAIERDYEKILSFREGARYRKMDLHTHTPASECSSFTLPAALEAAFPKKKGAEGAQQRIEFVKSIAAGDNPFKKAYAACTVCAPPQLAAPDLDRSVLQRIAAAWLEDVAALCPVGDGKLSPEQSKRRDDLVESALRDVSRYLKSLFFPSEYVLRCHIEGLELVAITDHNHPGYIVPRLPELGTWFSQIQAVARVYAEVICAKNGQNEVRAVLLQRLRLACRLLKKGSAKGNGAAGEVKKQHPEKSKSLTNSNNRLGHIKERIDFWRKKENRPLPLIVLPGVEITASNVHLLALFPPHWYASGRIAAILSGIGIPEEHWGRGFLAAASSSVQDTMSLVDGEGGLVIPAHSNSDFKGLLRLFRSGLALNKVLEHHSLLALETTGGTIRAGDRKKKGLSACETLHWLDVERGRPIRDKPLCFVKNSDAHEVRIERNGTGEDLGMRFSYVKMDIRDNDTVDEIFRSLRLALLSGQSRLVEFPVEDGYNYRSSAKMAYRVRKKDREALLQPARDCPTILGLSVVGKGSYAEGLRVRFSPFLNCVVGSGGKSTVIRLLAYAFGVQGFMARPTTQSWLPQRVRVYWAAGDRVYCTERSGRHVDPAEARCRVYARMREGGWRFAKKPPDPRVCLWPPPEVQAGSRQLSDFEGTVIDQLVSQLDVPPGKSSGPLLINQPRDIFNVERLFEAVLAKPQLKCRQIIWSTGSPNVPTALDAEKIIITTESRRGDHMELVCAGDLHEDEIRGRLLSAVEGGPLAFARRTMLYTI